MAVATLTFSTGGVCEHVDSRYDFHAGAGGHFGGDFAATSTTGQARQAFQAASHCICAGLPNGAVLVWDWDISAPMPGSGGAG